ncbi:MAG: hypothetical protein IKI88_01665 [Anaerotignum sp.]|nr:hypothetical protein [Anaerotignum sp.]
MAVHLADFHTPAGVAGKNPFWGQSRPSAEPVFLIVLLRFKVCDGGY